jgi:hypothetical protein
MHNNGWHMPLADGWHITVRAPAPTGAAVKDEQYYAWISNPIEAEQAVRSLSHASKATMVFADKIASPGTLKKLTAYGLVKGGAIKQP